MSDILTFVSVIQSQMQSHFPRFVGGVFAKALDVQPLDFSRIRWSFIIYEIIPPSLIHSLTILEHR